MAAERLLSARDWLGRRFNAEFLIRAVAVAREAIALEREADPAVRRHRDEVQFLPAALEVMETPISPVGRALAWALMALFAIALGWSIIGEVDVVAVAQGKIVPTGRTKVVQPLEAGVVRAIHVEDGQRVVAGQPLIELDPTQTDADEANLTQQLITAQVEVARWTALIGDGTDAVSVFAPPAEAPAVLVIANRRLLAAESDGFRAKLASLDNEITRLVGLRDATAATIAKLEKTVPLLQKQVDARQELVDKGFLSSLDQDNRRLQYFDQDGELKTQRAHLVETSAAVESARRQRQQAEAEFLRDGLTQKDEADKKIAELSEELRKAHQRAGLQTLAAPIDGVVQQLDVHTIGGVVTPAQKLLSIVPEDGGLEIEAQVLNRDIGFIEPGQPAEVKIETFSFTKYGTVDGTVISVSHDAVQEDKQLQQGEGAGGQNDRQGAVYAARIRLAKSTIEAEGRTIPLGAGMAATVEIKTEKRRIIEYLLSPLAKYGSESMRER